MNSVKLLALDLDGTLLNSQKELTPRTRDALYAAAEAGVEIVPTTGRFFTGMPEVIQKLPFLHYAITINGAQVYDIRENKAVSTAEIPLETARDLRLLSGQLGLDDAQYAGNRRRVYPVRARPAHGA